MLRMNELAIYKLKRQDGVAITITKPIGNTYDLETGRGTRTETTVTIKRAIALPVTLSQKLLAKAEGLVIKGVRNFLIDVVDLPADFEIDNTCFIFCTTMGNQHTYKVESAELTEDDAAYFVETHSFESEKVAT